MLVYPTDLLTAFSAVATCLNNVGPGLGELGSLDNYSMQPSMAKFIFTFDMFLGRVEIYPVLIAMSMIFRRNR